MTGEEEKGGGEDCGKKEEKEAEVMERKEENENGNDSGESEGADVKRSREVDAVTGEDDREQVNEDRMGGDTRAPLKIQAHYENKKYFAEAKTEEGKRRKLH